MLSNILLTILGLALLLYFAEQLLNVAVYVSEKLGIPKFVIGLTVLAMGTSIPELVVNLVGVIQQQPEVRFNVVGSNITNIFFVASVSAVIFPIVVKKTVATRDVPFVIISVLVFILLFYDRLFNGTATNELSRSDGLVMLVLFGVYLYYVVFTHKHQYQEPQDHLLPKKELVKKILIGAGALVGVIIGGTLAVENIVLVTETLGFSKKFAGVIAISIGTSLPELITSLIALRKNHPELAMGNIIGSNVYNLLFILGISASIAPISEVDGIKIDLIFMSIATLFFLVAIYYGKRNKLERKEGVFGILMFVLYILFEIVKF